MADLEVVGRHALLFDDDANAAFVNSDDALVDWNSLLIDRYDVRHLLSRPPPPRNRRRQLVPPADASIAAELDRERFLDLISDRKEQDVRDDDAETVAVTGYRAVGFSYGNPNEAIEEKNNDAESVYYPPFPVPGSLIQNLPPNEKLHQIIARTATFVHNHGGQSEIVLRVKQGDNPTFGFLMPGHHLHPYFRFLVDHQELLQYDANAKQEKPGNNISNQTGGALSLLGSMYGDEEDEDGGTTEDLPETKTNKPQKIVDTISPTVCHKSDPSVHSIMKNGTLLNNKEKLHAVKRNSSVINSVKSVAESVVKKDGDASGSSGNKTQRPDMPPSIPEVKRPVVEPPSELKRAVEKIVEFILRNGREFEAVLAEQDRKFGRFPFLLQSNLYHPYYLQVLQETQESKLSSKSSVSEKHEPRKEKKTSRSSSRTAENDFPDEYDKKEKFKMVLGKSIKDEQELPPKVKQEPPSEIVIDAEVAAAILKAATRGIKDPGLEIFPKLSRTNVDEQSSNDVSQSRSSIRKDTIVESSVPLPVAQATAETANADSSEALLTNEQKLKAERLKRAKMFAARVKNGVDPLKPESLRSLSVEPPVSGVSSSGTEVVNLKGGKEREGSLVEVDVDDLEKIEKFGKKSVVGESDDQRTKRSYRSRSRKDDDKEEDNDEEDKYSKKRRSHRSSRHGEDRHRHRKSRSSSKHDDEKYSDNDDYQSTRKRQKYRNSDDDDEEHWRHSRRRCKHDGSSDNEDRHRRRADKKTEHLPEKEAELEDGEISAKSDQSIAYEKGRVSREASVDVPKPHQGNLPSRPLELMEVPDDLRAKIRAMLMATM